MLSEIADLTVKWPLPGTGAKPVMHTEATRCEEKLKENWFCRKDRSASSWSVDVIERTTLGKKSESFISLPFLFHFYCIANLFSYQSSQIPLNYLLPWVVFADSPWQN